MNFTPKRVKICKGFVKWSRVLYIWFKGSFLGNLEFVMGEKRSIRWFLPTLRPKEAAVSYEIEKILAMHKESSTIENDLGAFSIQLFDSLDHVERRTCVHQHAA